MGLLSIVHVMVQRAQAAAEEGERQEERAAEVAQEAAGLQGNMEGLQGRLQAAWQLHANLAARTGLLADLHRSLPRPLTPAEAALKSQGLPALEWRCRSLQADITVSLPHPPSPPSPQRSFPHHTPIVLSLKGEVLPVGGKNLKWICFAAVHAGSKLLRVR